MTDFDYVIASLEPWIDKYIDHGPDALSTIERVGVGIWMLEAEVNNGGFDQYYFNSAGDLAVPTVQALIDVGATNTASLLAAANSEFPNSLPPADRNLRQQALEKIRDGARFGALEQEFYSGSEDLAALLAAYLRTKNG
jgi:hypothetical protein